MRGGFTFCGVDIADLGLEYAPDSNDFYVYKPGSFESHIESYQGQHGGHFYGATVRPKEFKLRCIFQENNVQKGLLFKVFELFKRGRTGKLVFQRRPWCYYMATVTDDIDTSGILNYINGVITINLKALYPFAKSDFFYIDKMSTNYWDVMQNTYILELEEMMPKTSFESEDFNDEYNSKLELILYNPGTERTPVEVVIGGNVGTDGVEIINNTTGQRMSIVGLTHENTDQHSPEQYLHCDCHTGKTIMKSETSSSMAFLHHKGGFIELESAGPIMRDVAVSYTTGTNTVTAPMGISEECVGMYAFIEGGWKKIIARPAENVFIVNKNFTATRNERATIVHMNEIMIYSTSSVDISKLEFIYKPVYA